MGSAISLAATGPESFRMATLLTRHERRKLRTRRKLLDAARQEIARRGYEATGVLDITEAADVSKGTFYLHFRGKEDLTRTLILEGFAALRARLTAALGDSAHPAEGVEEALRVVFRHAAENRDLFRIMLGPQASAELHMTALEYFSGVVEEIIHQITAGQDLPVPPGLLARFVTGGAVQVGLWWIEDDHGLSPEAMAATLYCLLTRGVLPAPPASPPSSLA